jgi:ABC-type phosphate/phosphonate transport system substrate-binding protein
MLLLGSAGTAEAAPPDSLDIVYIDGLPCNSLCQSYMAWSRKASSMSAQAALAPRFPKPRGATGMRGEGSRSATHVRLAKPAAPNSNETRQAPIADSQPASNAVAVSNSGTTPERVTAATAAPAPEQNAGHSDHAEAVLPGVAEKPASAPPNNRDHLVAILVARPEIKSVSDLTNKSIAIDDRQAASDAHLGTAIAAAGAGEVQLSEGQTKAINRLISGEVSAAVLTSIYPEAADWLPEIAGFTIFRIPLSPPAVKARLESAGDAAAGSNARTTQQQVAAATTLAEQVTAAPAPEQKANNTAETAPASPGNAHHLVALLMARPDIKSVSDLANKNIAIDARQSASNAIVRTAIVAAGATEVQLSEGQTAAVDRLINGEVPAAVLALVSPQAAGGFPTSRATRFCASRSRLLHCRRGWSPRVRLPPAPPPIPMPERYRSR